MKKPTEAQIKKEIKTLKEYQHLVRPTNVFGDSNIEAIGAQIEVLEKLMDEDEINEQWGEDERITGVAIDALNWRQGMGELQSKEWKPLITPDGKGGSK